MWQAVIAKQEDNLYYLLKFFAESLDDNILKRETSDADILLAAMGRNNREVRERDIPEEFKNMRKEILEDNKKLMEKLSDAQKPTGDLSDKDKKYWSNRIDSEVSEKRQELERAIELKADKQIKKQYQKKYSKTK